MDENKNIGDFYIPAFLNSTTRIIIGTAIMYFIFAQLSLLIIVPETNIPPFFPAIGFGVAFALIFGRKAIIGVAIGSFAYSIKLYLSNFDYGTTIGEFANPLMVCFIRPLIASVIVLIVSYLTQLWCKNKYPFSKKTDVVYFTLAALIGSIVSLALGLFPALLNSSSTIDKILLVWTNWSQSNLLGIILVTPLVLSWFYKTEEVFRWTPSKKIESILLIIVTLGITLYVFKTQENNESIIFFLLIWAASRFEMRIITLVTFIVTVIAVKCTIHGLGGFGWNGNFLMLQLFLFVNITSVLFLKAILREKENEESKLRISEKSFNLKNNILQATIENPNGISIFSLDTNLNYISFNSVHARYMKDVKGIEIKIGDNHPELFSNTVQKEETTLRLLEVLKGKTLSLEEKHSEEEYLNISKSPIKDNEGQIIGITTIITDISELKLKEIQLEKNNITLNERIKELCCLYDISEIINNKALSISEKLETCVQIIPKAMQFPEMANCRIQMGKENFISVNSQENDWYLKQKIAVNGEECGYIEIGYFNSNELEKKALLLDEEVQLLEALAGIFSRSLERKLSEEKLLNSEEKFRAIYENSLDIYFRKDLDGILLEIGPSVEKHLHRTQEFMIGKNVKDFYCNPADGDLFYEIILKEQQIYDYEELFLTPTGESVYFSVNAKLVYDSDGKPQFVEGTKRNISERIYNEKQLLEANEKVKESEEKFRSIYESLEDIYFKRDLEGVLFEVSPSVEKHFNIKREAIIGQNAYDFFVNRAEGDRFNETILQNKQVNDYEERFVTANGEIIYFSVNAKVIYNTNGEPVYFEGTMRNVNERIQNRKKLLEATEKIKESEEKFRSIYENSLDIYFKKDLVGTILEIGPSVDKHLHQKRESMIGKNIRDYYYDITDVDRFYEIILKEEQIIDYQERFITATGESVYLSVNAKLVYDANGKPIFVEGTRRNISERILNEKHLLEANDKIKDSEEKFRSIFENMQDVYYLHTIDGILVNTSPSVEKYFDAKREDLIGENVQKLFVNPLYYDELTEITLREGFINDREVEFVTAAGETMYFSVNSKLINDSNDNPTLVEGTMRNISERINNQKQLLDAAEKTKESEEKFRSIFENTQDVYYMHNLDGRIFEVSPSVEKHFKYTREEMIGKYTRDLYYDQSKQNNFREKITKNGFINDEYVQFVTGTGEPVYFSVTCKIIFDKDGEPSHIEGSMRNINDRIINQNQLIEAAEKIKESEEKFRSIYENMQDIYYLLNMEGEIIDISPAVEKHFQVKRENVFGINVKNFYYNPIRYDEINEILLKDGFTNDQEVQFLTTYGETMYFSINSKLINNADGKPAFIEGTMRNISERISNQKQLLEASGKIKESEEKFRSIYENMQDVYYLHDLNGTLLDISPSVEKQLKYKREEMIGRNTSDFHYDLSKQAKFREKISRYGYISDENIQFVTATGEPIFFSVNCKIIYDENGTPSHVEGSMRNINERIIDQQKLVEATEKIKKSEEEFRAIFESFEDLYFRVSLDGTIQNVSPSVEKILKFKRDEIINTNTSNLYLYSEDRNKVLEAISKNGQINDFETVFKDKDNNPVHLSVSSHMIHDAEGNAICIEGTMRDISERKKNELEIETANETIRESEKKYRTIFESVRDVFFRASAIDHTILDISPSCAYFNVSPEDIIGKPIEGFYQNPNDRQAVLHELQLNGEIKEYDAKFLIKNKTYTVSINSKIAFDQNNEPEFIIGSFRDISARIQAEENLKLSEAKFRSIYENFEDVYYKTELNGTVIDLSPSFEKNFKMKRSDVIGNATSFRYENADDRIRLLDLLNKNEHVTDFDTRYIDGEGNIVSFSINARILKDSNGTPIYVEGTLRNINERSFMQEEMLRKNRTLEFQNTELEQFAYIASHDLQEPLITVIHCIELLQEGLYENLDEDQKQYLQFINSSTSRMQLLVKGLLDYSRIGKERKTSSIDCNEIVANVIADMNVSLKESNAVIEYENLPVIEGYTTEIRQLFQNIISNANKYRKKDQMPKIKIAAVKEENNWIFSIEDNGIGIKEEDMDKVFVIFKRLHNRSEYQGTGIGLSHCKKIIEHHNGEIWVESKYDEGSIFKWTFPIELN